MGQSLRNILEQHVANMTSNHFSYIEDFLKSEEYTVNFITDALGIKLKYPDVLSYTPEQIAANPTAKSNLETLIHKYIKLLPFTERPASIAEFNKLFSKEESTEGYLLYSLRTFNEKTNKPSRENYCKIEDLLDGVEIEILLLKRLQKGELELLMDSNSIEDSEITRNTLERLASEFCMKRQAIKKHIERLKYTHNLLGYDLNIDLDEQSKEYGLTTIHPVFLALNPSEAVLLTVWLKKRFPKGEGRLGQQAAMLADDIYRQLSNHGKQIVQEKAKDADVFFEEPLSPRESVPEHRLENYINDIAICYKRDVHCRIKLKWTGDEEYEGYLGSRDGYTLELRDKLGRPILKKPERLTEENIVFFKRVT